MRNGCVLPNISFLFLRQGCGFRNIPFVFLLKIIWSIKWSGLLGTGKKRPEKGFLGADWSLCDGPCNWPVLLVSLPCCPSFSRHDICQKLHNRNIWEPSFTPKKSVNHDIVIFAPKHHVYNFDLIWRGQFLCIFRTPILSKYVKDDIKAKRVTLLWNWRARTIIIPSGRAYNVIVASWSLLLVLIQISDNLKFNAGRFIFTITKPFITRLSNAANTSVASRST